MVLSANKLSEIDTIEFQSDNLRKDIPYYTVEQLSEKYGVSKEIIKMQISFTHKLLLQTAKKEQDKDETKKIIQKNLTPINWENEKGV